MRCNRCLVLLLDHLGALLLHIALLVVLDVLLIRAVNRSSLVRGNDVVVNTLVKFLHDVVPRVEWQLRVEDASLNAKLLEEELEPVRPVDVVDEQETLALDELELEEDVGEQELIRLGRADVVLGEVGRRGRGILLESKDGLRVAESSLQCQAQPVES